MIEGRLLSLCGILTMKKGKASLLSNNLYRKMLFSMRYQGPKKWHGFHDVQLSTEVLLDKYHYSMRKIVSIVDGAKIIDKSPNRMKIVCSGRTRRYQVLYIFWFIIIKKKVSPKWRWINAHGYSYVLFQNVIPNFKITI